MDPRRAPPILRHHATDESPQWGVGPGASGLAGDASPVRVIRSSVPGDDGGGFDDRQGPGPVGPHLTQRDPEDAINRYEPRTAAAVRESGELLPQGEIIQYQRLSRARQGAKPPDGELEEEKHRRTM